MLMRGLEFLWNAFWELTTERPLGFNGEGRIPGSKITEFAKENGFRGDALEWFRAVIREMDAEYLGLRTPGSNDLVTEVKISDTKGIRSLLRKHAKNRSPEAQSAAESQGHNGDH